MPRPPAPGFAEPELDDDVAPDEGYVCLALPLPGGTPTEPPEGTDVGSDDDELEDESLRPRELDDDAELDEGSFFGMTFSF